MSLRSLALPLAAAGAFFGLVAPASAQTQALALVSSDGPVELTCFGQTCAAEFSSFCLQPERGSPTPETRFALAPGADIRVVGQRRDGGTVELNPAEALTFQAIRTHVAVRVTMSRARLAELGLARLTVAVGERVALLPTPGPDEPAMSASELAAIATSLRPLGQRIVDHDGERMLALRAMDRMINLLPPGGRESEAERAVVWDRAVGPEAFTGAPESVAALVRRVHDDCANGSANGVQPSMRSCIQSRHDTTMGGLNNDFWDSVKNGT